LRSSPKTLDIIAEGRGTHFDPALADLLLRHRLQFMEIFDQCTDGSCGF